MKTTRSLMLVMAPLLTVACATTPELPVPTALVPDAGQTLAMTWSAQGVQVYECRTAASGSGHTWAFVAPDADLFNDTGNRVGRHGAGPFWQADDSSRIVGSVEARADAPAAGAIPWLLLSAKSETGTGVFCCVTSVQRIHTVGGLAPTTGCTADRIGTPARIAYSADYRFFNPR